VERIDVAEAIRLVKVAIQQAAIDPRTGIHRTTTNMNTNANKSR
jgi:DNA replicative helicase MCM subunit Mcm2 (Cdc46/Mcm family)